MRTKAASGFATWSVGADTVSTGWGPMMQFDSVTPPRCRPGTGLVLLRRAGDEAGMIGAAMAATPASVLRPLSFLVLLAGCASARSSEPVGTSPPEAPNASPSPTAATTTVNGLDGGDAVSVDGFDGLARLCEAMRDEVSLRFQGSAVEQARAAEAHAQARRAALAGRYVTVIPATGYEFRRYEPGERKLPLDTNHSLLISDGAELFVSNQNPTPGFAFDRDRANHIVAGRLDGKVALWVIFRPVKTGLRRDTCVSQNGGRMLKLAVETSDLALLGPDGSVLARSGTGERAAGDRQAADGKTVPSAPVTRTDTAKHAESLLARPVRSPRVIVSKAQGADGRNVPFGLAEALQVLGERARPCYERALTAHPALRGTLVLDIRIGADQQVESSHVEVSLLADDALAGCVAEAARKATILETRSGQRLSVSLQFGSADD